VLVCSWLQVPESVLEDLRAEAVTVFGGRGQRLPDLPAFEKEMCLFFVAGSCAMNTSSMSRYSISKTRLLIFFLTVVFTAVPVYGQQDNPAEAYFVFDAPPRTETFVIKLIDPQTIREARNIIATGAPKIVIGSLIKQPVYYNSPWSYHLDPKSINFVEGAVEVCDASMGYLEDNLDIAYADWCPWNSRLLKEISPPAKPGTENLAPTISMKSPYADNTYRDVSPAAITLVANADDADGTIVKVAFNSGNVIGETTTYPYSFTWQPLAAGTYTVSATATDNKGVSTTSKTVTFVINQGPPQLLTDADTSKAAVLESVTLIKGPFAVISEHPLSSDQRTRLLLFGVNLELRPNESVSAITAQAEDSQQRNYVLPVEASGAVPKFPWLTQVTVKLPDELQGVGDVWLSVSLLGVRSNKVPVKIR
jgi:hypothetical protein